MQKKTIKVPFEIILRNKKTKEEIKAGDLTVTVPVSIDKKKLHKIMEENLKKENSDEA